MIDTHPLTRLTAVVCFCGCLAAPAMGSPAGETPLAVDQLVGTRLILSPRIAYRSAALRISGPGDYALAKRFPAGSAVSAYLLAEAEPDEDGTGMRAPSFLADGRYRYEVVFTTVSGESRRHSGLFFVEGGSPVARRDKRSALENLHEDLARIEADPTAAAGEAAIGGEAFEADYIVIFDDAQDGITELQLRSTKSFDDSDWEVQNYYGDLRIEEQPNGPDFLRMTLEQGGEVGIGTTAPQADLHVQDTYPSIRMETDDQANRWMFYINTAVDEFRIRDNNNFGHVIALQDGAGSDRFFAGADGQIGMGTDNPEADLHLVNADGAGDTTLKLARSGTGSWNLGHTATGVFTFNKSGTGGQEFTVRNRNHGVATLDVQGHVRGTSFKSTSSREVKTGFEAVDPAAVLAGVSELSVTFWRYRDEEDGEAHIGPVAEDFREAFGIGDGETIASVDADGVALAAIQGLNSRLEAEILDLRRSNAVLEQRLAAIEARLAKGSP